MHPLCSRYRNIRSTEDYWSPTNTLDQCYCESRSLVVMFSNFASPHDLNELTKSVFSAFLGKEGWEKGSLLDFDRPTWQARAPAVGFVAKCSVVSHWALIPGTKGVLRRTSRWVSKYQNFLYSCVQNAACIGFVTFVRKEEKITKKKKS